VRVPFFGKEYPRCVLECGRQGPGDERKTRRAGERTSCAAAGSSCLVSPRTWDALHRLSAFLFSSFLNGLRAVFSERNTVVVCWNTAGKVQSMKGGRDGKCLAVWLTSPRTGYAHGQLSLAPGTVFSVRFCDLSSQRFPAVCASFETNVLQSRVLHVTPEKNEIHKR